MSAPIALKAQLACVRREISMRKRVYPRAIDENRMTEAEAAKEIAAMEAVYETLCQVQQERERQGQLSFLEG